MSALRELWAWSSDREAHLALLLLLPFLAAIVGLVSERLRTRAARLGHRARERRSRQEGSDSRARATPSADEAKHT